MRKALFIAIAIFATVSANAQYTSYKAEPQKAEKVKEKASKQEKTPKAEKTPKLEKVAVMKIAAKYAAGSCPLVDGKVEWSTTIKCPGLSAQQIYDKSLEFLEPYCKEKNKDENSQIALVNPTTHEIGARIGEYVVFTSSALSLDRAMMHYTLCLYCSNGECKVVMKSISYKYQDNFMPAEDMLSDENALNKTQTDFHYGGYKKFRTKSVDAKDALFQKLSDAINQKP